MNLLHRNFRSATGIIQPINDSCYFTTNKLPTFGVLYRPRSTRRTKTQIASDGAVLCVSFHERHVVRSMVCSAAHAIVKKILAEYDRIETQRTTARFQRKGVVCTELRVAVSTLSGGGHYVSFFCELRFWIEIGDSRVQCGYVCAHAVVRHSNSIFWMGVYSSRSIDDDIFERVCAHGIPRHRAGGMAGYWYACCTWFVRLGTPRGIPLVPLGHFVGNAIGLLRGGLLLRGKNCGVSKCERYEMGRDAGKQIRRGVFGNTPLFCVGNTVCERESEQRRCLFVRAEHTLVCGISPRLEERNYYPVTSQTIVVLRVSRVHRSNSFYVQIHI